MPVCDVTESALLLVENGVIYAAKIQYFLLNLRHLGKMWLFMTGLKFKGFCAWRQWLEQSDIGGVTGRRRRFNETEPDVDGTCWIFL